MRRYYKVCDIVFFLSLDDNIIIYIFYHFHQEKPLSNRQLNFDRLYPVETGTKRNYEDDDDESSISGTDETDNESSNSKLFYGTQLNIRLSYLFIR